jgi:pyridoxine 5'-phosphate synthase PdxJ
VRTGFHAGAHSIVAHLREDRRHIQDRDVYAIRKAVRLFNLEMSLDPGIIEVALDVKPDQVTLVPERRQELTTEGGLDAIRQYKRIEKAVERFARKKIVVSLFIARTAARRTRHARSVSRRSRFTPAITPTPRPPGRGSKN